jgi:hypothetical protein
MQGIEIPIGAPLKKLDDDLKNAKDKLKKFSDEAAKAGDKIGGATAKGAESGCLCIN